MAARIAWAAGLAAGLAPDAAAMRPCTTLVGTSLATQESVPAAFAVLAASPGDPWLACRMAASLGGDCDTIAAMAGAIGGACHGAEAFPARARGHSRRVNDLRLDEVAAALLGACGRPAPGRRPGRRRAGAGWPRDGRFGRLLHLGNVVVDVVLDVPALPDRGGDVLAGAHRGRPRAAAST